jgi:hypothetical protein
MRGGSKATKGTKRLAKRPHMYVNLSSSEEGVARER